MTVLSRKTVRDEIATGLRTSLAGTGLPVSSVYSNRVGKLNGESPVLLVLSGQSLRSFQGMGTKRYQSAMTIEIHSLIYDGDQNNPLTESQREDKADEIEAGIAGWIADHQIGTSYRSLRYGQATDRLDVQMLDGNPYLLEIIYLEVEGLDT